MSETLLNEEGWEALANIRLRRLAEVTAENNRLRSVLERCRTVLGNMALENEQHPTMGYLFKARWPISHEPLRADARGLLPVIDKSLTHG